MPLLLILLAGCHDADSFHATPSRRSDYFRSAADAAELPVAPCHLLRALIWIPFFAIIIDYAAYAIFDDAAAIAGSLLRFRC
jgi:hypothetical protein